MRIQGVVQTRTCAERLGNSACILNLRHPSHASRAPAVPQIDDERDEVCSQRLLSPACSGVSATRALS